MAHGVKGVVRVGIEELLRRTLARCLELQLVLVVGVADATVDAALCCAHVICS
jgi:hypothetical protein